MTDLALVPSPGQDLVPDGWCDSTGDQGTACPLMTSRRGSALYGSVVLPGTAAQLDGPIAAYRTLGADTLELVKARRHLEIRWGELLGEAVPNGGNNRNGSHACDPFDNPHKDNRLRFRRMAANRDALVGFLSEATDADEMSRASLLKRCNVHVGNNAGDNA